MAFLRKVCSPRTTNLVCTRSSNKIFTLRQLQSHVASTKNGHQLPAVHILSNILFAPSTYSVQQEQRAYFHNNTKQHGVAAPQAIQASGHRKATANQSVTPSQNPNAPQRDPLDVSFNDPVAAFKSKTTWELIRAYIVYLTCSSSALVEHNMKVFQINFNIFYIIYIIFGNFCVFFWYDLI